jgi:hypothetical protein
LPQSFDRKRVLEVGILDINGSVPSFFINCSYIDTDVAARRGVGVVCQAQDLKAPDGSFDHVVPLGRARYGLPDRPQLGLALQYATFAGADEDRWCVLPHGIALNWVLLEDLRERCGGWAEPLADPAKQPASQSDSRNQQYQETDETSVRVSRKVYIQGFR